jgi:hypothetical protein
LLDRFDERVLKVKLRCDLFPLILSHAEIGEVCRDALKYLLGARAEAESTF